MIREARKAALAGLAGFLLLEPNASAQMIDDPFWDDWARYAERIDTLSVASGDARNVNAVTHIINPWPLYARDRRIPANAQRMVGAIDRYQNPKRLGAKAPTLAPVILPGLMGAGGGGESGGAGMGGGYGGGQ